MNADQILKEDFQINAENIKLLVLFRQFAKRLFFGFNSPLSGSVKKTVKQGRLTNNTENPDALCIEISSEKINMLLKQRLICASDIRCLDRSSKQCLQNLCLKTCLHNTPLYLSAPELLDSSHLAESTLPLEKL